MEEACEIWVRDTLYLCHDYKSESVNLDNDSFDNIIELKSFSTGTHFNFELI